MPLMVLSNAILVLGAVALLLVIARPEVAAIVLLGSTGYLWGIYQTTKYPLATNSKRIAMQSVHSLRTLQEGLGGIREVILEGAQDIYVRQYQQSDMFFAAFALLVLAIPTFVVALMVRLTSEGPILYWSIRAGRHNRTFMVPKFRSMLTGTPAVATHLLVKPNIYLTPIGDSLRTTCLDELPQLWSILRGDMSFVGPRPALFNQQEFVEMRTCAAVVGLLPGLTGWAQVNGRDELPIAQKVAFNVEYMNRQSLLFDLKIMMLTFVAVIKRKGISH